MGRTLVPSHFTLGEIERSVKTTEISKQAKAVCNHNSYSKESLTNILKLGILTLADKSNNAYQS